MATRLCSIAPQGSEHYRAIVDAYARQAIEQNHELYHLLEKQFMMQEGSLEACRELLDAACDFCHMDGIPFYGNIQSRLVIVVFLFLLL